MRFIAVLAVLSLPAPAALGAQSAHVFALPYVGSAPETGVQVGATAFRVTQPADTTNRPSTAQVFASYTAKHQARAFIETDRWSRGNVWHAVAHLELARTPLFYYGFGDRAPASAEEAYTPRGTLGSLLVQRQLRGPLYLEGGYQFQDMRIASDSNGALRTDAVRGARGGRVGQLQGGALWDSRDDVFAPYRGSYVEATGSLSAAATGSDFAFRRLVVDARHFVPLGGRRILALQVAGELTGGDAPFDLVSLVGSSNYLRGYATGRFRDQDLLSAQAEYRAHLWRRIGCAAFAGAGTIAPRVGGLLASGARVLPSYGAGVRWQLFTSSRSAIRVDYARGTAGSSGLYLSLNEAF
ncbi:MAG: BamA/TamA family outer membrane protein [Gemmatimonadaceae bacterium]|nr:BamA/TamA family outer membrane protein [Gemmatimonadaceae bacterium]